MIEAASVAVVEQVQTHVKAGRTIVLSGLTEKEPTNLEDPSVGRYRTGRDPRKIGRRRPLLAPISPRTLRWTDCSDSGAKTQFGGMEIRYTWKSAGDTEPIEKSGRTLLEMGIGQLPIDALWRYDPEVRPRRNGRYIRDLLFDLAAAEH